MPDNVVQTLQHLLQDVLAPDVRELKIRVSSLEKQMDVRFDAVDQRFVGIDQRFVGVEQRFVSMNERFDRLDQRLNQMEEKMDMRFDLLLKSMLAALSESWAQTELNAMRLVAPPSDRVAILEARAHS